MSVSAASSAASVPATAAGADPDCAGTPAREPLEACVLDHELRYTAFNDAHAARFRELYGVEIRVGDPFLDHVTVRQDRAELTSLLQRALAGEDVIEEATPAGDGRRGTFRLSANPIRDAGAIVGVMLLAEDVTEIYEAAAQQARLNRELRAITMCNEVLVRATDEQALLDTICRIIVEDAGYTMAWVGYLERDEGKLIRPVAEAGTFPGELASSGITWAETPRGMGPTGVAARTGQTSFIQNIEADPLGEPWREDARRYGRRAAVALPLKDEDGVTFGVLSICTMHETFTAEDMRLLGELAGDLAYGIVTIRARAAQRDLEAQLRQSQKMEVIGQLAGGIAHDFNNLLTAIRGYGELLGADLLPSQAEARNDVQEVLAAVDRAESLTRGLLAFSRRHVLQPKTIPPAQVIERVAPMLRRLLGEHVELVTRLNPHAACIRVDPGQLEQVLVNLAVNARDAMPAGGRLVIATGLADVGPDEAAAHAGSRGRHVVLSVSDTGSGMDADTLEHLFEPFFTTKAEGKGTGLGLATVQRIVRQSGGHIRVRSAPGEGSEFRVFLPQVAPVIEEPDSNAHPASAAPYGSGTVLLVEDDQAVREFATRALEQLGYRVLPAPAGADALFLAAAHPGEIDLLLTDIVMPGMQGPEVLQHVRAAQPNARCLFMSGFADLGDGQGERLNGSPVLSKPFSIRDLAVAVGEVLGR